MIGKATKELQHEGKVPMSGFPSFALKKHVATLVNGGHIVSIMDQISDPVDAKKRGVRVQRALTRVFTPGTVIEDEMLQSKEVFFRWMFCSTLLNHKCSIKLYL